MLKTLKAVDHIYIRGACYAVFWHLVIPCLRKGILGIQRIIGISIRILKDVLTSTLLPRTEVADAGVLFEEVEEGAQGLAAGGF